MRQVGRARRWVGPLALVMSLGLGAVAPGPGHADPPRFTLEPGVELSPAMRSVVTRIASDFFRRTGRGIVVTSGTRSAREQAAAMYEKMRLGQRLTGLYQDRGAAAEIQSAYRASQRRGRGPCIDAMTRVIEAQVRRGVYISRHLRAGAVDVRSRDMSRRHRRIFQEVVRGFSEVSMLYEGTPPHFHLQLRS